MFCCDNGVLYQPTLTRPRNGRRHACGAIHGMCGYCLHTDPHSHLQSAFCPVLDSVGSCRFWIFRNIDRLSRNLTYGKQFPSHLKNR